MVWVPVLGRLLKGISEMARRPIVILGGGGHAKVIIDMLVDHRTLEPVGCIVNDRSSHPPQVLNLPVLGDESYLEELLRQGVTAAVVAVGENRIRARITSKLKSIGMELVSIVSEFAKISSFARIGEGVVVMPMAVVGPDTTVEEGAIINTSASVDHDCFIGSFCHVAPGCSLAGNVRVGSKSFLGVGTAVLPDRTIGRDVIVGAGAVVIKDVPDGVTVMGVPARLRQSQTS